MLYSQGIKTIVELSCRTEYALLALLELTRHYPQGEPLQIKQIAAQQNIPDRYLEQLLAILRRGGFVQSQRGAKGGYLLAQDPWKITLLDIINCLEGDSRMKPEGLPQTVEAMVVEEVWREMYDQMQRLLQSYTLQDLLEKRDARQEKVDIMYYI
ncbi:Rrf2 family transcriptional regulator [Spirulina subsalsa FACHB-351]|uniref:Rrf2 family transcriptional regulator n=1 Tax=Spirulina subsalsa FACHB-351 TaxID=234711 RepID=A0ABT3L1U2_9CYAN|nr:Rrf2 family transcriptional regulator [Spirulina subsalsa]MCW6035461.1 Rrf2 family transcriptional regulator [Spirulina subsalsa FACHB-351]